jgi:hypothetical protein
MAMVRNAWPVYAAAAAAASLNLIFCDLVRLFLDVMSLQ